MKITYPILISPQQRSNIITVEIEGYRYLEELWGQLDSLGVIDRLKDIPQLGNIPVCKALRKTRYDYVMLQMYLHQFVKKRLIDRLEYSYNNYLSKDDLVLDKNITVEREIDGEIRRVKPSIGDCMQILAIVYNIGHYYNTFSASRAVVLAMGQSMDFKNSVYDLLEEQDQYLLDELVEETNYHRIHLINSLILLSQLDSENPSVLLAKTYFVYTWIKQNAPIK